MAKKYQLLLKKNKIVSIVIFLIILISYFQNNLTNQKQNHNLTPTTIKKNPTTFQTPTINQEDNKKENSNYYRVIKVIDGDTIDVKIGEKIKRVRIIGINTPEIVDPRKTVECFGKEASKKAKEILLDKNVTLQNDLTQPDFDKYDRLLRYVFLEDGTDYGLQMIKEGYAYEYTYKIPYQKQSEYKQAQKQAQIEKKGLWADNACQ